MAIVINRDEILSIVKNIDVVAEMEKGFIEYSNGNCIVPPVGELLMEKNNGETHIKYGYIKDQQYYVIKVASGFYDNPKLGIPSSQGLMLVFNQKTGQTEAVLLDEGHLTNIRTAAAGALVAKYFAPKKIKAVGIVGAGTQGKLQLKYLQENNPCKEVWVWDINKVSSLKYKAELESDFNIHIAETTAELAHHCNLIVTSTPSQNALLHATDIRKGTHITAVGSDTPEKQELDSEILVVADIVVSDSISQSKSRGEIYRATRNGSISPVKVIELGVALQHKQLQRTSEKQITVTDLTGVAVQDIMIAQSVYLNYKSTCR
jgi:ornithine cyclodeaminase/alanine dehydrogenase-like protein (mu-crystallin family)